MNNKSGIWSLISSFWDKGLTKEEKEQLNNWLSESEQNMLFIQKLNEQPYNSLVEQRAMEAKERVYTNTLTKIKTIPLRRDLNLWRYAAVASVILMLLIGGFSFYYMNSTEQPILVETQTLNGINTKLTLSDGTTVELNSSSSLKYPLNFQKKSRNVYLEGEAFFEVSQDRKRPFIVDVNDMKVKVLGTKFNVQSYSNDEKTITTLLEGSVSVEFNHPDLAMNTPIILKPDQQIIYDKATNNITIKQVKAELYTSWKDDQMYFENEPMGEIIKRLERQFGARISIQSEALSKYQFSGFFSKNDGLEQILNSFRRYRNFDYKHSETGIEIFER